VKRTLVALAVSTALLTATAAQAFADDCTVANKPAGAGSVGTVNLDTGAFTPAKANPGTEARPHGAFVTLTGTTPGGGTLTADTFVHAPTKAQAPTAEPGVNPGATEQESQGRGCDGKGLDTLSACFGAGA
jgi:hypothetical protein